MIQDFAKLFRVEGIGQILVVIGTSADDECVPELKLSVMPPNLGVCSIGFKFKNSDEGWSMAEKGFEEMTEEKAIEAVTVGILNQVAELKPRCYQCDQPVSYLFADSRCKDCTRLSIEEVTGGD